MLGICGFILTIYERCCEFFLELPGARVVIGRIKIWQILFYYGCVVVICVIYYYEKKHTQKKEYAKGQERNEAQECEKQRKRGNILTGMLCALGLFVLLHRFDSLSQMQVTVLDVGQGDGIFLKSPGGMTCMIDGGSSDVKNVGQYRIEPYLLSKGVGTLDYVFISHGDSDHTNGIEEMISRQKIGVKIKTLVFPKESVWDESLKKLAIYAIENGVQVAVMEQGQEIHGFICQLPGI